MAFAPFVTAYTPEPSRPASGPQPGARALMDWTLTEWDQADAIDDADPESLGIYAARDVCGNWWPDVRCTLSQHARGAADDVKFPNVGEGGHPEGWKYARWLVENAAVLGVQEVIYARQRWTNITNEWRPYNGRSPHLDHVHVALNASGARYLTAARIESVAPKPPPAEPEPVPEDDDMECTYIWLKDDREASDTVKPVSGVHCYAVTHAHVNTKAGAKAIIMGGTAVHQPQAARKIAQYFAANGIRPIGTQSKPMGYEWICGIFFHDGPLHGL